eukprot:519602-Amphidinium_carterae.1
MMLWLYKDLKGHSAKLYATQRAQESQYCADDTLILAPNLHNGREPTQLHSRTNYRGNRTDHCSSESPWYWVRN